MTSGAIDHVGVGVPDLTTAKRYYDGLMPMVGFTAWFPADDSQFNYGPAGAAGTQVFFYRSIEPDRYSRHGIGLQHLAFKVDGRVIVDQVHAWAIGQQAEIIHAPRRFPEYSEHCYATFFLDPHGIMLEVVTHEPSDPAD